ncbi:polymorphic outer membrane protein middle domain-containing protein, partial [Chlamydia ibidis]|uniref:polymorphic outer membrane protein middle domain-containing protein n=1 Tax=Chlamydia ibidis TaxID=1405396 RepID=UPI00054E8B91
GGGGGASKASITASSASNSSTQPSVTSLSLVDADGNGYEYPIFGKNQSQSRVVITGGSSQTVSAPTTNNTTQTPHYGYQGNWTVSWAQGSSGAHEQNATFTWEKTGYIANPERVCALVP